ncbi:MAG: ComEC/Rec2 family competence protein [Actinomycetales bacterium]|nr:ComEC/Rec2 family competence protein [Actinomycetales bacterium]
MTPRRTMLASALAAWLAAAAVLWFGQQWRRPWLAAAVVAATVAIPGAVRVALLRRRDLRAPWAFPLHLAAAAAATLSAGFGVSAVVAGPVAAAARATSVITTDAIVQSDVRISPAAAHRPASASVQVRVVAVRVHHQTWRCATPAQLILTPAQSRGLQWGAHIRVTARARPVRPGARSAAVLIALEPPTITHAPPWWARTTDRWRRGLQAAAGTGEAAGLLPALAIGDTSAESTALADDMRVSGLSHLSAVSGANLSIIIGAVVVVAMLLGVSGRAVGLLALLALAWFVAIARPSPSVLRAAAMGVIGLAPLLAGWRRVRGGVDGLYALSLASCVLVVLDPWLALSWGYALSFCATLGLVVGAGPVQRWLNARVDALGERVKTHSPGSQSEHLTMDSDVPASPCAQTDSQLPTHALVPSKRRLSTPPHLPRRLRLRTRLLGKARHWFIAALAVSVCAQVAVAPVLLLMGARISWVSLPANLLAEPAVATATISGLSAAAASQVSPAAAHLIARPGVLATGWIAAVAHRSARAADSDPLHVSSLLRHLRFTNPGFPPDAQAVLCDVGQGTALVLPLSAGSAVVVDVGPDPAPIDACLSRAGITAIPLLVLSHFHADHVNGLAGTLRGRTVGRVLLSPLAAPPEGARLVAQLLAQRRIPAAVVSRGARFDVADARVEVLAPTQLLAGVQSPPNDDCVAVALTIHASWRVEPLRVLAPCDLEYAGQESLLAANPTLPGDFDIAVVPHHGSAKQLETLAAWANPHIALIPVGVHNDYGHPAPDTVTLWGNRGRTQLGRTDTDGDLVIRPCGQQVCLAK